MPASASFHIISRVFDVGPIVHTILVLRWKLGFTHMPVLPLWIASNCSTDKVLSNCFIHVQNTTMSKKNLHEKKTFTVYQSSLPPILHMHC
jgi:hypothetical protein